MLKALFAVMICLLATPPAFAENAGKKSATTGATEKVDASASDQKAKMTFMGDSLYDRLGGKDALKGMVDAFIAFVAADGRINRFFVKTDYPSFKAKLVEQLCQASGGPCTYTGKSMKDAHKGMGISATEFNALVEDLSNALDRFKVGKAEKDELLSILGPMQGDIVEKK